MKNMIKIISIAVFIFVLFILIRGGFLSSAASKLYSESKAHSYKSMSLSYSLNIEDAEKELEIAKELHKKADSIYYKIWPFNIGKE